MTDGIQHNAHQVAQRYRGAAAALRGELSSTLDWLGPRVAVTMKQEAPKYLSTLTNSVTVVREDALSRLVKPTAAHAYNVEKGRKPGKGLPRFYDPAAKSAVGWLESKLNGALRAANPKYRPGRIGSKRRTAFEQELKDRYMAWSRHVKLKGIKADPFVRRTTDQWRQLAPAALRAAVRRGLEGNTRIEVAN
jgi:hypothetical protein